MEHLTISTICEQHINPIHEIAKLAAKHECRILFSRYYSLGLDYIAMVHVAGNWSGIAKMEASLPILAKQYQIDFLCKRTQHEKTDEQFLPYSIQIFSLDQPGIIYEISDFLETQDIRVDKWQTNSYLTVNDTPVFTMKTVINVPATSNIADFRENFLMFCDELNLDGTLEPEQR